MTFTINRNTKKKSKKQIKKQHETPEKVQRKRQNSASAFYLVIFHFSIFVKLKCFGISEFLASGSYLEAQDIHDNTMTKNTFMEQKHERNRKHKEKTNGGKIKI